MVILCHEKYKQLSLFLAIDNDTKWQTKMISVKGMEYPGMKWNQQ